MFGYCLCELCSTISFLGSHDRKLAKLALAALPQLCPEEWLSLQSQPQDSRITATSAGTSAPAGSPSSTFSSTRRFWNSGELKSKQGPRRYRPWPPRGHPAVAITPALWWPFVNCPWSQDAQSTERAMDGFFLEMNLFQIQCIYGVLALCTGSVDSLLRAVWKGHPTERT